MAHRRADAPVPAGRDGDDGLSRRRTPARLPGIVDSHAHLQHERFAGDRDAVIGRAVSAGVERILVPGWDVPSSEAALELADRHAPIIDAAVGVHPHHAAQMNERAWARLETLVADARSVAVGEIGLDYFRNLSPREVQRDAFARQLAIAAGLGRPVLVHDRDAHADVAKALEHWSGIADRLARGVLHAFSGTPEMAERLGAAGYLVSFALPVAFRSASGPRAAAPALPVGRLLVETDAPYLGPDRDGRNEPAAVLRVAAELARLRAEPVEELALHVRRAYADLIG